MAPPREPMFQCWRHWAFIVLLGLLNAVLGGATNISSDRLLLPIVVNTWPFTNATDKGLSRIQRILQCTPVGSTVHSTLTLYRYFFCRHTFHPKVGLATLCGCLIKNEYIQLIYRLSVAIGNFIQHTKGTYLGSHKNIQTAMNQSR